MSIIEDIKFQYRVGGITNKVIYWNVGIFLLSIPFFYQFVLFKFNYPNWLVLSPEIGLFLKRPWTFLTYSFLHANLFHLIYNIIVLNFAGRLFLTFFTQKQFLGLYVLSAIFSGLCFVLIFDFLGFINPLVGASGAIMAILVAVTTYQPLMCFRFSLIGNVKLWHISGVFLLNYLLFIYSNTGGHIAHFSGAFFGYVYIKLLQNGTDMSQPVTTIIDFFAHLFSPKKKTPFKKVHVTPKRPTATKVESKIVVKDKTQQQIDEILDKISQSGYDSLTADEKEFLFKAGK